MQSAEVKQCRSSEVKLRGAGAGAEVQEMQRCGYAKVERCRLRGADMVVQSCRSAGVQRGRIAEVQRC